MDGRNIKMIDWQKVAQDLEHDIDFYVKANAELLKQLEQTQMALREQVELNKYLEKKNGTNT
jgi:hypothetical protein